MGLENRKQVAAWVCDRCSAAVEVERDVGAFTHEEERLPAFWCFVVLSVSVYPFQMNPVDSELKKRRLLCEKCLAPWLEEVGPPLVEAVRAETQRVKREGEK